MYPTVKEWYRKYKNGKEGIKDGLQPGALCPTSTERNKFQKMLVKSKKKCIILFYNLSFE